MVLLLMASSNPDLYPDSYSDPDPGANAKGKMIPCKWDCTIVLLLIAMVLLVDGCQ